jgi:hypothetical protein
MGNTFTTPAILDGVTPRKDGSLSLRFVTQEMSKDDIVAAMEYYQSFGYLLFKENEINMAEIPEGNAILDGGKSPSKRLKDRMFVAYRETHEDSTGFNAWYERQLEKIGSQYLDRLDTC